MSGLAQASFSERIKDRNRRWWTEGADVEFKEVAGKLEGRAFAEEMGCSVPELYGLVAKPDDIPSFDGLPERFVIKPSRGWSAKNVFVLDHGMNLLDGKRWNRKEIVETLVAEYGESGRRNIRYMIEEFLINWDGKPGIPLDYKFYMFGDQVAFIHVIERNSGRNLRANKHWYFDEKWSPLEHKVVSSQELEKTRLVAPVCLDDLLGVVKKLAGKLNMFMRIDMYATTRGPVFGEFTPQPHGGNGFTEWADGWLGDMWQGLEGCG